MKNKRMTITSLLILSSLLVFEIFSWSSSREGFLNLTGMKTWSNAIAWALVLADLGGIGRYFSEGDDDHSYSMMGAWVLSAVFDTYLTYLSIVPTISARGAVHPMVTSGTISLSAFTSTIPIMIAIVSFMTQFFVVTAFNQMIARSVKSAPVQAPRKRVVDDSGW